MRVMIPMLATTYGESVTLKENKMFVTLIYKCYSMKHFCDKLQKKAKHY